MPFGSPLNAKLPDASAVTVPLDDPVSVSFVPGPLASGPTVPEIEKLVKFRPATLALLMVTVRLAGVKTMPAFDGVTV